MTQTRFINLTGRDLAVVRRDGSLLRLPAGEDRATVPFSGGEWPDLDGIAVTGGAQLLGPIALGSLGDSVPEGTWLVVPLPVQQAALAQRHPLADRMLSLGRLVDREDGPGGKAADGFTRVSPRSGR